MAGDKTDAEQPGDSEDGRSRKKVLVSGCFDLLHSGHIEFFKQAAQHGDLYVRLGTDANVRALKNHETMYKDAERLYMVRAIRWVHDAAMSKGSGVYDFEQDMKELKPDIYFVNDDASKLEGRVELCKKMGIEMRVATREPADGLEARSSTSMKARLREMVEAEEKVAQVALQSQGMKAYDTVWPWRFCFAGGWMDLKWCNELVPGCVVTINIKYHPDVCKDYCGLATSSRKHGVRVWNGKLPTHFEAHEAASYLWGAENFDAFGNEKKPYIGGSQDHCGLFFPGINKLCYDAHHWPTHRISLHDASDPKQAAIFSWLESVLWIIEIPFVSRPGDFSSQRINLIKDPKVPQAEKARMVKAIADASEQAWQAILAMDSVALGKALSDTMKAWAEPLPYTVDPFLASEGYAGDAEQSKKLRDYWSKFDIPHTHGCLFSGAGGGFLMVISDTPVEGGVQIKVNTDHICKPYPSDRVDSDPQPLGP